MILMVKKMTDSWLQYLAEAILLGFQHYLVMLCTIVLIPFSLVPQMGGGNEDKAKVIQTLQFVAGLNTLTQTMFRTRLPAVIGGSYTFVPMTLSIVLAGRYQDNTVGKTASAAGKEFLPRYR